MGKFSRAFKDAKAAFKVSVNSYKCETGFKRNLDKILDAYAVLPEYVRGGAFTEYILSTITLFEKVYNTEYIRKSEIKTILHSDPCDHEDLFYEIHCPDSDEDFAKEQHE